MMVQTKNPWNVTSLMESITQLVYTQLAQTNLKLKNSTLTIFSIHNLEQLQKVSVLISIVKLMTIHLKKMINKRHQLRQLFSIRISVNHQVLPLTVQITPHNLMVRKVEVLPSVISLLNQTLFKQMVRTSEQR